MPAPLLLLFALAMILAVVGQYLTTGAFLVHTVCATLLVAFVLLARLRGVRGPVV